MLYRTERELCVHVATTVENHDLHTLTKHQRNHFAGTGMVRRRRLPMANQVRQAKAAVDAALKDRVPVVWLDNFNRQRYSRNPNKAHDQCINGSVLAVTGVVS